MCQKGNKSILIESERNWCQALQYCRIHYTDLVSISDDQQNEELKKKSRKKSFWIGLLHDEWEWADESCSTYRKWGVSQPNHDFAATMDGNIHTANNIYHIICSKGSVRIKPIPHHSTWEEALIYCKTYHTRLLCIEDEDDQRAVEQWLDNYDFNNKETLWIGLRQSSLFGFWIWSDRTVNWHNWKNKIIPELSSSQCGVINATDYTWSEENCWNKHSFLCEEDIVYMDKY
ncbi:C-type lection lectoxin-Enh3 isoform X2 [Kryptolebias marmoratus]|nr:C-type lection lectoxin-Enh3 isoform X2 [Kryptolebias marmoratus]